jgi:hypothetical protein
VSDDGQALLAQLQNGLAAIADLFDQRDYAKALRDAMALAGSRRDAFTLLLTSPEFQRR